MMDLFSGPNAPLAKAFLWCGWRVLTPIDLAIDEEFDVKTRAREKGPGPMPLQSKTLPRGLPGLSARDQHRVDQDNLAADFGLAMQQWEAVCTGLTRANGTLEAKVPGMTWCQEWVRQGDAYPTKEEAEYTPSLAFTLAICATAWAHQQGFMVEPVPRLPPIFTTGDCRKLLEFDPALLRAELMAPMALHLGLRHNQLHDHQFVPLLPRSSPTTRSLHLATFRVGWGIFHIVGRSALGPTLTWLEGMAPILRRWSSTCRSCFRQRPGSGTSNRSR